MLYDLFSWMSNCHQNETSFIHAKEVTRSEVVKEQESALRALRVFVSEYRLAKYEAPPHSPRIQTARAQLTYQEAYLSFLDYLLSSLKNAEHGSLMQLALNYVWAQNDESTIAKMSRLFHVYWQLDKEQVLIFYQTNQTRLPAQLHLAYFSEALILKTDALSVAPLIKQWIDEPETLAGAVLWLLQQSVSLDALLETGILHHLVQYNLNDLHSEDSSVIRFYSILTHFPLAFPLIERARQISCDSRGFDFYSLTGQCNKSVLEQVKLNKKTIFFDESENNLNVLYRVFGLAFLKEMFLQMASNANTVSKDWLQSILNNEFYLKETSALIHSLIQEKNVEQSMEIMARLLNKNMKEQLLEKNDYNWFYLLPYDPELCGVVRFEQIESWLQQRGDMGDSPFEMVPQLGRLLPLFATTNQTIATLIYTRLIQIVLQHPACLEDNNVIALLKKHAKNNSVLKKTVDELEEEFISCLTNFATQPFTTHQYYKIEDKWLSVSRRLSSLHKIHIFPRNCPSDKYAMQACIAKTLLTQKNELFDLNAFMQALEVTSKIKRKSVTEYERLLIEMLIIIDNDAIRNCIFEKLGEAPRLHMLDQHLFRRVVANGNLGLLTIITNSYPSWLKNKLIKTSLRHAQQEGHWACVKFFCEKFVGSMDKALLKEIVIGATRAGNTETIAFLCNIFNHKLTSKDAILSTAFRNAIECDHKSIVQVYCKTYKLNCADYLGGIQLAYELNQESLLKYLSENVCSFIPQSELQKEIDSLLVREAARGRLDLMMAWLPRLEKVQPSQKSLIAIGAQAAKKGNQALFKVIYPHLEESSLPLALSSSLIEAARAGNTGFINHLYDFIVPDFAGSHSIKIAKNKAIKRAKITQNEALLMCLAELESAIKQNKPSKPVRTHPKKLLPSTDSFKKILPSVSTDHNPSSGRASATPKSATYFSSLATQSFFALKTLPRAKSASFLPAAGRQDCGS